jgi:hypothetical protein
MVDTTHLEGLINHIRSSEIEKIEFSSKFIIFQGKLKDMEIMIYDSGIIIYKGNINNFREFEENVLEYFKHNSINPPKLDLTEEYKEREHIGWESTPKSVWLTKQQIVHLKKYLASHEEITEHEPQRKHEEKRYLREKDGKREWLVINNNSTVFTVGGYDQFDELIRSLTTEHDSYSQETIFAINVGYQYSKIGPIIATIVMMDPSQLQDLQIAGIKHKTLVRSFPYNEQYEVITKTVDYYENIIIEPFELNSLNIENSYEEYTAQVNKLIENKIVESLQNVSVSEDIIFLMDETSTNIFKERIQSMNSEFTFTDFEISVPLSIASVLTYVSQKRWLDEYEKMIGYELNYKNTDRIMQSPYKHKILKLKYFNSE